LQIVQLVECQSHEYLCVRAVGVKIERRRQRPFDEDLENPVGDQLLVDGRGPEVRIWKSVVADEGVLAVEKRLPDDHLFFKEGTEFPKSFIQPQTLIRVTTQVYIKIIVN